LKIFGCKILIFRRTHLAKVEHCLSDVAPSAGRGVSELESQPFKRRLFSEMSALLDDPAAYARMSRVGNPYGDGRASCRIAQRLTGETGAGKAVENVFTPE
jgi:hypothetical protein